MCYILNYAIKERSQFVLTRMYLVPTVFTFFFLFELFHIFKKAARQLGVLRSVKYGRTLSLQAFPYPALLRGEMHMAWHSGLCRTFHVCRLRQITLVPYVNTKRNFNTKTETPLIPL